MSKVCHPFVPFPIIRLWMHSISSHFCMTTYVTQLVRGIQNWFKMPSSCMIMLQLTQRALCILWCRRGWEVFTSSLFFWPQTPVHETGEWFPNWSRHCIGSDTQRGLWTAVWCEEAQIRVWVYAGDVHRIPYHMEQWNMYNFADYVVGCLRVYMSSRCCMLFQIHCVHNSDYMIQEIHGSLTSGSCVCVCVCVCMHTHTATHFPCCHNCG